jgi:tetratricopeptide (TPR) repeat protein
VVNTKVTEIGPLKDKGTALLNLGKSNESIAYFDKALAINPNNVNTLTQKGLALIFLNKPNHSFHTLIRPWL